jgi:hypothetical protein
MSGKWEVRSEIHLLFIKNKKRGAKSPLAGILIIRSGLPDIE